MDAGELEGWVAQVAARYPYGAISGARRLTGGEWKEILRLDAEAGPLVLSILHPTATAASVAWEHALLTFLRRELPEIPAPLAAHDGSTWFAHAGRLAAVVPLMPGAYVDDDAESSAAAARYLARLHRVGQGFPGAARRPGVTARPELDWLRNESWDWSVVEPLLRSGPDSAAQGARLFWELGGAHAQAIVARRGEIAAGRELAERFTRELRDSGRPLAWGPVHDDYHLHNLLAVAGRVSALLDWDGAHPDWLMVDLSNAVWEFCHDDETHALDLGRARAFVDAYHAAGGPIAPAEIPLLTGFIRCRRVIEVLSSLQRIANGDTGEEDFAEYMLHNLDALALLEGQTL